jgi:hypothetical protein
MDMDHGTEVRGKAGGGKTGKGFVHDRNRADLFLGEFVGPLEVVDLYLAGIRRRSEILRLRISGVYRGEQLIYFFLGQNFGHLGPYPPF